MSLSPRVQDSKHDVIILGSGLAGTILAAILSRSGADVLILDSSRHPRFAIGESTIPQTSFLFSLLAKKFDVPELHLLGLDSPGALTKHVAKTCGVKRNFGFAYHRLDRYQNPTEIHLFGNVWRDENHLFREDVDLFLLQTAKRYGTTVCEAVTIRAIDTSPDKVELEDESGNKYSGCYLVDATGFKSPLAEQFGLRDAQPRYRTRSRSIFSHLRNVEEFQPFPFSGSSNSGTFHHVFPGGWMWIIPFGNHPDSINDSVSVGLQLDPKVFPDLGESGEDEFRQMLNRLPSVKPQFAKAVSARPWTKTKRLQYSSEVGLGPRWCLTGHATGFVDPLFATGLVTTLESVQALAPILLDCLKEDDFRIERFEQLNTVIQRGLDFTDRIVSRAYQSWSDFEVWNAWLRVWTVGVVALESNLASHLILGKHSKFRKLTDFICSPFEHEGFASFLSRAEAAMELYGPEQRTAKETSDTLFELLNLYDFSVSLKTGSDSAKAGLVRKDTRELILGDPEVHRRWSLGLPDPHLV